MIYHYRTDDGRVETLDQPLTHPVPPPPFITLADGAVARRVWGAAPSATPKGWPLTCMASGVHPEQAAALASLLRDKGVPTEVTRGGDPIYTSPEHRRRALAARGMFDKNSFY